MIQSINGRLAGASSRAYRQSSVVVHASRSSRGGKKSGKPNRKRASGAPRKPPPPTPPPPPPPPAEHLSGPVLLRTTQQLQPLLRIPNPFWSTFGGHASGVWCGKFAAFNLETGEPEPVTVEEGKELLELHCRVTEQEGADCITRAVSRATHALSTDGDGHPQGVEKSALRDGTPGLLIFDGGSYSMSAAQIGTYAYNPDSRVRTRLAEDNDQYNAIMQKLFTVLGEKPLAVRLPLPSDPAAGGSDSSRDNGESDASTHSQVQESDTGAHGAQVRDLSETTAQAARAGLGHEVSSSSHQDETNASESMVKSTADEGEQGDTEMLKGGKEAVGVEGGDMWETVLEAEELLEEQKGETRVELLEHCLAETGRERIRVLMLLQTQGGWDSELDVDVLRLVLYRESWTGDAQTPLPPDPNPPLMTEAPRSSPSELCGSFRTLTTECVYVACKPADSAGRGVEQLEQNNGAARGSQVATGGVGTGKDGVGAGEGPVDSSNGAVGSDEEGPSSLYFTRECLEVWEEGTQEPNEAGATFWLPRGVSVTLKMVADEGEARLSRRHLVARSTWQRQGLVSCMETEFDAIGDLNVARLSTMVEEKHILPDRMTPFQPGLA